MTSFTGIDDWFYPSGHVSCSLQEPASSKCVCGFVWESEIDANAEKHVAACFLMLYNEITKGACDRTCCFL